MESGGLIRACIDVYRIGRIQFLSRRFLIAIFMRDFRADQRHQHKIGYTTFHVITNKKHRTWLINVDGNEVGGFYQVIDTTFVLPNVGYAVAPATLLPRNGNYSSINIMVLFKWMSSYPELVLKYGLCSVPPQEQEPDHISVNQIFGDFMFF